MERKPAEEQTTLEYLNEHLKERVLEGKHEKDFLITRAHISILKDFHSFKELLETTKEESMCDVKETIVRELVKLYQDKWYLRQSTGIVLLMVLWGRLARLAPGEWFDDGVYWLFEEAALVNAEELGIIESLMEVVRKKAHSSKFYAEEDEED